MDSVDIMAEFKTNRFVVASSFLLDDPGECVVILADFKYWNDHYNELEQWCEQHGGKIEGMGLTLPDAHTLTLFTLRWS
jgi:hypothetical protein